MHVFIIDAIICCINLYLILLKWIYDSFLSIKYKKKKKKSNLTYQESVVAILKWVTAIVGWFSGKHTHVCNLLVLVNSSLKRSSWVVSLDVMYLITRYSNILFIIFCSTKVSWYYKTKTKDQNLNI